MIENKNIIPKGSVTTSEHFTFSTKKSKYHSSIQAFLLERNYVSGKALNDFLQKEFKISSENSRKIIQRAVADNFINSTSPITFGNGQYIYTHPNIKLDKDEIKEICKVNRPSLFRLIDILDKNGGVISYYEALKITATNEERSSTKVETLSKLIDDLKKLKIADEKFDQRLVKYIVYNKVKKEDGDLLIKSQHNKMFLDSVLIPDILTWMYKNNIIDNLKWNYRNKNSPSIGALQNNLLWDAFAYTKTTGINKVLGKKANAIEKQTLVAFDIVLSREYFQVDLDGFYNRVQINLNSVKSGQRKIMPIIIYREISAEVFNKVRALGFLCFNIAAIYGSKMYEIINNLNLIQSIESSSTSSSITSLVEQTLNKIKTAGQEDSLKSIKGILFEFLIYPLLRDIYSGADFVHGKMLSQKEKEKKENYEYDYIIRSSKDKEIIVIELKGYSNTSFIGLGDSEKRNTLSWFFRRTLPFASKFYEKERTEGFRIRGCYITSGFFYKDSLDELSKINEGSFKAKD